MRAFLQGHLPLLLTEADYARMDTLLTRQGIARAMESNYRRLLSPVGGFIDEYIYDDPLGLSFGALGKLQELNIGGNYTLFDDYLFSKDMTTLMVFISPRYESSDTGIGDRLVERIEAVLAGLNAEYAAQGISADYFGAPAVAAYNARQIKHDMMLTLNIAILVIVVFITLSFRNKLSVLLALIPVALGGLLALAVMSLVCHTISAIAVGAGTVVMGIALSYSIHILCHANHCHDPRQIIRDLAYPLTIGSITTIGAFAGLLFTDSQLLRDFGLFASLTLVGTTLFSLVLLPHLIRKEDRGGGSAVLEGVERLTSMRPDRNRAATVSGLVLMPGAILMGIMNPLAGKWFDRHGPRRMAIVGMSLLTLTTFAFAILNLTSSIIYITIVYTVRMFSMSLVNMPITTWGMNALDNKVMNHGTSVNNTLRQVAGSLGTAIIIAVSTQVQNIASPGLGATEGTMLGINAAFLVCTVLCLVGLVMTIALVKDKPGEEAAVDEEGTRKSLLTSIMKTDVYSLSREATVEEAMRLFVEKNISAAPIVDESGEPVGFISDGDILKRLSPRSNSFTDPIVLINSTVNDDEGYDEKLAKVMQMRASEIGAASPICVSVHANLTDVCRVLSENHLKKVPVLEAGHIVGIINRSDITQYSMAAYLADHPERAVYCGEGPSGQHECVEEACEEC